MSRSNYHTGDTHTGDEFQPLLTNYGDEVIIMIFFSSYFMYLSLYISKTSIAH